MAFRFKFPKMSLKTAKKYFLTLCYWGYLYFSQSNTCSEIQQQSWPPILLHGNGNWADWMCFTMGIGFKWGLELHDGHRLVQPALDVIAAEESTVLKVTRGEDRICLEKLLFLAEKKEHGDIV
ncbi:hypothetical protein BDZ45DRAFT_738425 [Acephala macrosclerotiorum]|nr:hypothetical protein BDZ45DRAFT_738425 [Acephala macrosclerotiorum]